MKENCIDEKTFFFLLKVGLWEELPEYSGKSYNSNVNWTSVYQLAENQSVVGIMAAGIDLLKKNVPEVAIPKEVALRMISLMMLIEQRNVLMNDFVANIIEKLRAANVYALLVKGQGIAQCYERPLWRACGDIDLLLSTDNYKKAKAILTPIATAIEPESLAVKHFGLTIDNWTVELHGSLRSGALPKMDKLIDDVQNDVFNAGNVRSWMNGKTKIFIPSANNDVIFIFTHILKHFFHGGIGLRQLCDWCRLLWTYKDTINHKLLMERIKRAGLTSEWKSFAAFAVEYLGMPVEAMPFYSSGKRWSKNASRIKDIIISTGDFGKNLHNCHKSGRGVFFNKISSFKKYWDEFVSRFLIFPKDAILVWSWVLKVGTSTLLKRERQ